MKKIILFICFVGLFSSCAPTFVYTPTLRMTRPEVLDVLKFSDENIEIEFKVEDRRLHYTLKNISGKVQKIVWDNAGMNINGVSKKVFHTGVKYIDATRSYPPTIITPGAIHIDAISAADHIELSGDLSDWRNGYLFKEPSTWKQWTKQQIEDYKKNKLLVYLPITIENVEVPYYFEFKVADLKETKIKYTLKNLMN